MAYKIVSILFFCTVTITSLFSQVRTQENPDEQGEKIYIHFDKPYYVAGETIWYKAYLYKSGLPAILSTELFIQLEDENGKIIDKKRNPVSGATTTGSITLDAALPNGNYFLKAITRSIAGADKAFMYSKRMCIYNFSEKSKDKIQRKNISLQFFPESGHLIDRVRTNIAFKATDEEGLPVDVKGVIRSDSGTVITHFISLHDGMGKLSLTPHLKEFFFAEINVAGVMYSFPLPKVEASGVYLKVVNADTGKIFEITRSKKDNELFDSVRIVVKINKDTVYEEVLGFGIQQTVTKLLLTKNIPSGILHFIVLNKFGRPLAERLSFLNNQELISNGEIIDLKRDSGKRAFNSFEFIFPDTIQRSFSISVTDAVVQEFPDKETIYSGLLLTSDLKGTVYNPGFYFEKNDSITNVALDNLMLTQGWTRYNWDRKFEVKRNATNDRPHYLIMMSGKVIETKTGKPVSQGTLNVQLLAEDSTIQAFDAPVYKDGTFILDSLLYFGNARVYHTYTGVTGKVIPVSLLIDQDPADDIFSYTDTGFADSDSAMVKTRRQVGFISEPLFESKFKKLDTVFLKTRTRRPQDRINEKYAGVLYRTSGKLVLDNITNPYSDKSMSVIDYALINIRTLDIYRDEGILVNRKNFDLQTMRNWKVQVLLDEAVSTVASAKSITMDKVALIKFYEAGFIGVGSDAPGGAIAIYLKKYEDVLPGANNKQEKYLSYEGYSVTQEFYKPDYSVSIPAHSAPDNRVTLYWETGLQTNNTTGTFSFFNNDVTKKITVVIEGIDAKGRLFHIEKTEK